MTTPAIATGHGLAAGATVAADLLEVLGDLPVVLTLRPAEHPPGGGPLPPALEIVLPPGTPWPHVRWAVDSTAYHLGVAPRSSRRSYSAAGIVGDVDVVIAGTVPTLGPLTSQESAPAPTDVRALTAWLSTLTVAPWVSLRTGPTTTLHALTATSAVVDPAISGLPLTSLPGPDHHWQALLPTGHPLTSTRPLGI